MRLRDRVAMVTGGGSGIGRGIVLCMAREGADVAIPDVQIGNADKVAEEVVALGRKALAIKTDVTMASDVQACVQQALRAFGRIDILVNNAGVGSRPGMPFTNNTEEEWDRVYAVNVKSQFLICKALAPHLMERRAGKIINIASIAGPLASQTMPPYSVSKGAVVTFTRILAKDLAPFNINVNAICPGLLWTAFWEGLATQIVGKTPAFQELTPRQMFEKRVQEWVPLKREQTPEDIGHAAVFLASEEARNITGQALMVDGGIVMH